MLPGQTAQIPLIRKPLGREEQEVHTLAELKANPDWQTHWPLTKTSLSLQTEQDEPSLLGVEPAGHSWQAPLTLPKPLTHLHD